MGAVEGPPTSVGFRAERRWIALTVAAPPENPRDIGGPSTLPMLPRSARMIGRGPALALAAKRACIIAAFLIPTPAPSAINAAVIPLHEPPF